jgi:peptide/nickel transport system permease protein
MATTTTELPRPLEQERRGRSLWGDAWRRLIGSSVGRIGLAMTLALVLLAILVPIVKPYNPARDRNLRARLLGPSMTLDPAVREKQKIGAWTYPFGTDELGRNLFIRVLHGAPISLTVGLFSVTVSVIFGSLLGLVAGYAGGKIDAGATWVMDIMLAFPSILLAIAITSVSNSPTSLSYQLANRITSLPGVSTIMDVQLFNAMLAVGIVQIPIFGRIARGTVLSLRGQDYVTAATALGSPGRRILFRHILPNSLSPLMVQATLAIATAIIEVAALGFLGLGARPPRPEWGTMLANSRAFVGQGKWWYAAFPGLAIMFTVLGFNLLGDGLRDALDPRTKK